MDLVQRVKNICLSPDTEWSVIETETTDTSTLVTGYVLPLAGISAAAGLIGTVMIGQRVPFGGMVRVGMGAGLSAAVSGLVLSVAMVFVLSFLVDALAPTFGAQKNSSQSLKVAAYSLTPTWLAGVLNLIPALAALAILGGLYGIYVLYLGLPRLMKSPEDKTLGYTAVVVVSCFVIMFVIIVIGGVFVGAGTMGSSMMGGRLGR